MPAKNCPFLQASALLTSMEDYLNNLADSEHETDMVLAPLHLDEPVLDERAEPIPEWSLPCHSVILSAHSKAFAVSAGPSEKQTRDHKDGSKIDILEEGKRVLRLPLSEQAARKLLQFIYGYSRHEEDLSLSDACQLAVLSRQKGLQNGGCSYVAFSRTNGGKSVNVGLSARHCQM